MPVVSDIRMEKARLVVWEITETVDALFSRVCLTAEELERCAGFRIESRKTEWLAARALVQQILGGKVSICYDSGGAPEVSTGECRISISHTEGRVAVLFSPTRCGVDIELRTRHFLRVKKKIIGDHEQKILRDSPYDENTTCGIIWCAKEALFKRYGETEVDFVKDIRLVSMTDDTIFAHFREQTSEIRYFLSEAYILVVAG